MTLENALDFIREVYCSCGEIKVSHFNGPAYIRLVHVAAGFGHVKILALLNQYGCDMNAKSGIFERTPLLYAVQSRKLDAIDYLISIGVNVNKSLPEGGISPLHEAIHLRYVDVVYKLLSAKTVKINKKNHSGESPLFYAAKKDVHEAFLALLKAGADCNVKDEDGNTVLMVALSHGMKYIKPLIARGANPNIKNNRDETAVSMAVFMGMIDCCLILLSILRTFCLMDIKLSTLVRIDPPHPLVCRKRQLNGVVLWMRMVKLRFHVTIHAVGVA
jgi:ankyrin repeat protein